ncbi:MAG: MFS transporter [Phycisphaerae bacterium]
MNETEHVPLNMGLMGYIGTALDVSDFIFFNIVVVTFRSFTTDLFLIAILVNVHRLLGCTLQPYVAWKADHIRSRFGRRKPFLMVFLPGAAVLIILLGLLPEWIPKSSYHTIYALAAVAGVFILWQVCQEINLSAHTTLYPAVISQRRLGTAGAVRMVLSGLMTLFMTYYVMHWADINRFYPYLAGAIITALAIPCLLFTPENNTHIPAPARYNPLEHLHLLWEQPRYALISVIASAALAFPVTMVLFQSLYVTRVLHFSLGQLGKAMFPGTVVALILAVPLGYAVDIITPRAMMIFSFALWIIAAAAMAFFVQHWIALMLVQILYFVGYTIQTSAILALTFENVSEDERGAVFGIIQVTRAVATILASLIVGYLVNIHDQYRVAYQACIILAVIGIVAAWFLKGFRNPRTPVTPGVAISTTDIFNPPSEES